MRTIPAMTFRTALKILGHHDRPMLDRINMLLGGAILTSGVLALTGPTAVPLVALAAIWGWIDQKNEAAGLVRKLLDTVSGRRLGLAGHERMELIAAAHTVLVTCSVAEVFREELGEQSSSMSKLISKAQDELIIGARGMRGQGLLDDLYHTEVPIPSGACGFRENLPRVQRWQRDVIEGLLVFCSAAEGWDRLRVDRNELVRRTVVRYTSRYYELAAKVPEFMMWALLAEGEANRATVRLGHQEIQAALNDHSMALSRLEGLLAVLSSDVRSDRRDLPDAVRRSAATALEEPIVPRGSSELTHGREIIFPLVHEIYVEPHYRLTRYEPGARVSDERWWQARPVADDLNLMLAAHFASPESTRLPLLLLGHPGAGKSLLTKVLAARLPANAFTAVRVPLRYVTADAPIYRQIQQALDQATNGRVEWHALSDQTESTLRVILLDGLDELLQASEQNRTAFLYEVAEFQRTEAAQNSPVAVVVTSRTVVADRVDIPAGSAVVKLDDFDDRQIERWRQVWNRANEPGIEGGAVRALSTAAVHASGELSRQPLLLLMVALYSADPNLPPIDPNLSRTTLYRRLLENFARRESSKSAHRQGAELAESVREQLRRLSIAALGMFNRGRQDVTDVELGDDLAALDLATSGTARRTEAARNLTTQFFFIYTAQSLVASEQTYHSYEFLHATLGEYLVAREVVETLRDTTESAMSRRGFKDPDDDLLFALLSHQCLATRRSILSFAAEILGDLDRTEREGITRVLDTLISRCRRRHGSGKYEQYRPSAADLVNAVATYSANLFLLRVLHVETGVALNDIWPPDGRLAWRSILALWRSGLDDNGWFAMLTTLGRSDGDIVFVDPPEQLTPWNSELLHFKLADDFQTLMTLEMGVEIRTNPRYASSASQRTGPNVEFDPSEELARWLFQAVFLSIPKIDPDHLRKLLERPTHERYPYYLEALNMLLKQRSQMLPYDLVRVIVEALVSPLADHYAMMAAIISHPRLLDDVPSLNDPDRYKDAAGLRLMIASAYDQRAHVKQLDSFFREIEQRLDGPKAELPTTAAQVLQAYQWRAL